MSFDADARRRFGDRLRADAPLAPLTTFRVGGPADWLLEIGRADDLLDAVQLAVRHGVPLTMLGGGSNVLVADAGIRGLVIHAHGGSIVSPGPGLVRADAGVTLNALVRWTIGRGVAGLEAWAGTPGTVGGGVHGNAHFQGRLLGDLVAAARLADRAGTALVVPGSAMGFGYDCSRLQSTGEVLLWAEFSVTEGEDPSRLRSVARASLAFRKHTQPLHLPSAGCVFQNPDPAVDPVPAGMPASAGALVDRAGLKGAAIGGARVSPVHANFVVNEGGATARDIRALIARCRTEVAARFGVVLRDEIAFVGKYEEP